jgi:ABC-type bacteriocin/lantibiotic exporter with double-glycine peptidase domain
VFRFGQHLRTSVILAVYRKALTLALHARQAQSTGTITNLMSTDAKRLQDCTTYGMMLLSGPWQVAICLALLWQVVGVATLGGLATMLLLLPLNGAIARLSKRLQARLMAIKDERVSLTSEALAGIRLIKLNAWEDAFVSRIASVRDAELRRLRAYVLLQAASAVLWTALPLLVFNVLLLWWIVA